MAGRVERIREIFTEWIANPMVQLAPDGFTWRRPTPYETLTAEGFVIDDLDIHEMGAALVAVALELQHGLGSEYSRQLVSRVGDVILRTLAGRDNFDSMLFVSSIAAETQQPTMEAPQRWFLNLHLVLPFLTFPLLEWTLKRALSDWVELDGTAKKPFTVPGRSYATGRRVSQVLHLLLLHHQEIATTSPQLDSDIERILEDLPQFHPVLTPPPSGYEVLGRWRNEHLHGQDAMLVGFYPLAISLLILLEETRAFIDEHRAAKGMPPL